MSSTALQERAEKAKALLVEKVIDFIKPGGRVAQHLKGFEAREQQQSMMREIIAAYNESEIALIEAGTGTGKSMAYLIPALLWAAKYQERTVISTHTITLQEQLVTKDIPMLLQALGISLKAVLVKGMSNYLCMRKYDDATAMLLVQPEKEAKELKMLEQWLPTSRDGSRADIPFVPSGPTWDLVGAEPDTCTWKKCPHFAECHFVKAREQATDAQILVINHHLLFADLVKRAQDDNYDKPAVLPAYSHVIIDEAHNIEDVATDYFASRLTRYETIRVMARLASERSGKIVELRRLLTEGVGRKRSDAGSELASLLSTLDIDLPGQRREVIQHFANAFDAFESFVFNSSETNGDGEQKLGERKMRLYPRHQQHPDWIGIVLPAVDAVINSVQQFVSSLRLALEKIEQLPEEELVNKTMGLRHDIQALTMRLLNSSDFLHKYARTPCQEGRVKWIETFPNRQLSQVHLIDAELDVSQRLREYLFDKFDSVVLCSATMTVNRNFSFCKKRLGIDDSGIVREACYDSPFDYDKQALLAVPTDMPPPNDPTFNAAAIEQIWNIVNASQGNALVLFTSYQMLNDCYQALEARLFNGRFIAMKQGDDSRYNLLERFRNTDRSILFATHSFWEGIDIAGDTLRCVIIVKLPFKVPTEPIIQARTEAINAAGGDAFMDYSLPLAIVKFKQGFGRLIRHNKDRGCIVCLDPRLITKNYGERFLNSLPACQRVFAPSPEIINTMKDFFRKTHYLTVS